MDDWFNKDKIADRRVLAGPSGSEIWSPITSKTPIPKGASDGQGHDTTQNVKVNAKNWDAFLNAQDYSSNIEDQRTPDDMKFIELRDRWQSQGSDLTPGKKGVKPLTDSEVNWMQNYYTLMQVKNRQGLDIVNEEFGRIKKPGDRYYKKQPSPHPRD